MLESGGDIMKSNASANSMLAAPEDGRTPQQELASACASGHNGPMTEPNKVEPAIRVVMMPRDTNPHGTIFGGIILSYIDQAGTVEALRHTNKKLVTVAMHEVKFIAPVLVGDLVSFYTETVKVGNTSLTVRVTVDARRGRVPHETVRVTQAEVVYVAVDESGRPIPI
jgi:acyl-CoA thioesterase YciA